MVQDNFTIYTKYLTIFLLLMIAMPIASADSNLKPIDVINNPSDYIGKEIIINSIVFDSMNEEGKTTVIFGVWGSGDDEIWLEKSDDVVMIGTTFPDIKSDIKENDYVKLSGKITNVEKISVPKMIMIEDVSYEIIEKTSIEPTKSQKSPGFSISIAIVSLFCIVFLFIKKN